MSFASSSSCPDGSLGSSVPRHADPPLGRPPRPGAGRARRDRRTPVRRLAAASLRVPRSSGPAPPGGSGTASCRALAAFSGVRRCAGTRLDAPVSGPVAMDRASAGNRLTRSGAPRIVDGMAMWLDVILVVLAVAVGVLLLVVLVRGLRDGRVLVRDAASGGLKRPAAGRLRWGGRASSGAGRSTRSTTSRAAEATGRSSERSPGGAGGGAGAGSRRVRRAG